MFEHCEPVTHVKGELVPWQISHYLTILLIAYAIRTPLLANMPCLKEALPGSELLHYKLEEDIYACLFTID